MAQPPQEHEFTPSEGIWQLDLIAETLKFSREFTEVDIKSHEPSPEVIANFLSTLSPCQKTVYTQLRSQGWKDDGCVNFFEVLNGLQKRLHTYPTSTPGEDGGRD